MTSIEQLLPPNLLLGPHLSAYRYFFVCTLTIASWDTLVLTTRWWRMTKTQEWPPLKILMTLLRHLMPIEFIILAVSCFNPSFTPERCRKAYLIEPILSAILLSLSSLALIIRVRALHSSAPPPTQRAITFGLSALFVAQVAAHFACCFFYTPLAVLPTQGCIAVPKHLWGGIYWAFPTILYTVTLVLAVQRSRESLKEKPITLWKLINRDGLNLYFTIFFVNIVNTIYYFSTKPHDTADPIRLIVSTLATALTCTMTMRVILLVRGSLVNGGSFHGSSTGGGRSSSGAVGGAAGGAARQVNTATSGPYQITAPGSKRSAPGGDGSIMPSIPSAHIVGAGPGVGGGPTNKMSQPTFAVPRGHTGTGTILGTGTMMEMDMDVDADGNYAYSEGEGEVKKASMDMAVAIGAADDGEVWERKDEHHDVVREK